MSLLDGGNEDLIKKNKKKKPLGSINLSITMDPMTKEEMNEVSLSLILALFSFFSMVSGFFCGYGLFSSIFAAVKVEEASAAIRRTARSFYIVRPSQTFTKSKSQHGIDEFVNTPFIQGSNKKQVGSMDFECVVVYMR